MRKLLSIVVVAVMLVSIFAISANAIILPTYTVIEGAADEAVAVDQTFDGTNTEDFTAGEYGYANVTEDGALNLTAEDADNEDGTVSAVYAKGPMHIGTDADVARGQYVIEFDITKNDDLVGYQSEDKDADPTGYNYGVYVTAKRPGNAGTALEKYGVFIPVCVNTKGETYKYKVVFDEDAAKKALADAGATTIPHTDKPNTDYLTYGKKLMTVYETKPGQATAVMSSVSSYAVTSTLNGRVRFTFGSSAEGAFNNFNFYFGTNASSGEFNFDESDYTLDNIKIYAPAIEGTEVAYDYDFTKGAINGTDAEEQTLTYGNGIGRRVEYANVVTPIHSPQVMTFDAVNTIVGQPLTVNLASDYANTSGTHIESTEAIKDKWYSYKFIFSYSNYTGQSRMTALEGYRKEFGSDTWEALTLGEDYIANRQGITKSTLRNYFQFVTWSKDIEAFGVFDKGEWKVKNIQVVPDTAISGNAKILDGKIVADVNISANDVRAAYAASYKGGSLVSVDYVAIEKNADTFRVELPYSADTVDTATLYVWDNSAIPKLETVDLLAAVK